MKNIYSMPVHYTPGYQVDESMKVDKIYVCPKCLWGIQEEPPDLSRYDCPVCDTAFRVKKEKKDNALLFFELEKSFPSDPLNLPKGSVRAFVLICLSIASWVLIFSGKGMPGYLMNLILVIMGYYFVFRARARSFDLNPDHFRDEEHDPLFLPKGYIRGFILVGFIFSAAFLLHDGTFLDPAYSDFYVLFAGLVIGYFIQKITWKSHEKRWYIFLGHLKAAVILMFTLVLFILLISPEGRDGDDLLIQFIVATIGFYFASR